MIAKRVIYEGRVQGVGFRYACKDIARGHEVSGGVRNLPDGSVELIACGDADEVAGFLQEIEEESSVAHHIKGRTEEMIEVFPGDGFRISRD